MWVRIPPDTPRPLTDGFSIVTFVMLYFVLAIVNVLFLTIHAIRMIMQKDKGYAKAITSEGIIATTFFAYGAWMLRWISLR